MAKTKEIKSKIDLSDIKKNDLDKTSSFTDLMTKKERIRKINDDIEEMVSEKRKSKIEEKNKTNLLNDEIKKELSKTQSLEMTREIKFNYNNEINENKKRGVSPLIITGEINLFCFIYYVYLLLFTSYQNEKNNYSINGGIIILLFLVFGLSVISKKKLSKFFIIINIIAICIFIGFNIYILI